MKRISLSVRFDDPMKIIEEIVKNETGGKVRVSKSWDGARVEVELDDKLDQYAVKREVIKKLSREGFRAQ